MTVRVLAALALLAVVPSAVLLVPGESAPLIVVLVLVGVAAGLAWWGAARGA